MQSQINRRIRMAAAACRGFTLIELMAVVAVLGILAAFAYPSYQETIRKGKRTEGRAALTALMQQQERYYSQHNSYSKFGSSSTSDDEKRFKWYSGAKPATSAYEISGDACKDETIQNCVILTAKPGTSNVDPRYKDPECGSLTLTSTGLKGADGTRCWN